MRGDPLNGVMQPSRREGPVWIVEPPFSAGERLTATRCRHRAEREAAIETGGNCRSDRGEEAPQRAAADDNLPLMQPIQAFEFDQRLSW